MKLEDRSTAKHPTAAASVGRCTALEVTFTCCLKMGGGKLVIISVSQKAGPLNTGSRAGVLVQRSALETTSSFHFGV